MTLTLYGLFIEGELSEITKLYSNRKHPDLIAALDKSKAHNWNATIKAVGHGLELTEEDIHLIRMSAKPTLDLQDLENECALNTLENQVTE